MLYFVKPMVGDGADAEKAFLKVDYVLMFSGTQEMMQLAIDKFVNIIDRLPVRVVEEVDLKLSNC